MDLLIFLIVVVVIALGTWLLVVGRPRGRTSVRDKVVPRLRAGRGQDAPTRLSFEVRVEPAAPFRRQAASGQSADIWVLRGRSITVAGYLTGRRTRRFHPWRGRATSDGSRQVGPIRTLT